MNTFELITEPRLYFEKALQDIKNAKKRILIETYRIDNERIGKRLCKALTEKPFAKVIVDTNKFRPSKDMRVQLQTIDLIEFHPIMKNALSWRLRQTFEFLHARTHRKLTLCDDVAYIGGINWDTKELHWRDVMVRVQGPLVENLAKSFKELETIAKRPLLAPRTFKKQDKAIFRTKPFYITNHFQNHVIKLIRKAKKTIRIATPYYIPNPSMQHALRSAIKRGVKVEVLIPKKGDHFGADILSKLHAFITSTIGVKVYEYPKMMHAKYIIADDTVSVGSANFDYRSFHYNYEQNITVKDSHLVTDFKLLFERDRAKTTQFSKEQYKKRGWKIKFLERLLKPIKRYF